MSNSTIAMPRIHFLSFSMTACSISSPSISDVLRRVGLTSTWELLESVEERDRVGGRSDESDNLLPLPAPSPDKLEDEEAWPKLATLWPRREPWYAMVFGCAGGVPLYHGLGLRLGSRELEMGDATRLVDVEADSNSEMLIEG